MFNTSELDELFRILISIKGFKLKQPQWSNTTLGMNSGQTPPPPERLRPTLQLKIKANSWNEFRPTPPSPPEGLRPTLQLKIKANSWNEFRPTPPTRRIKANSSTEN